MFFVDVVLKIKTIRWDKGTTGGGSMHAITLKSRPIEPRITREYYMECGVNFGYISKL